MRARRQIAAGLLALAAGIALSPRAPALFDGVGFPDEAYRYAQVVAGDPVTTKPPTTGSAALTLTGGSNADGEQVSSAEQGPQVSVYVPAHAVAGAGSATVTATPEAPPGTEPADGPVAGNVYRIGVSGGTWVEGRVGTIALRSPQGVTEAPVLEQRSGSGWQPLSTARVGNDIWQAPLRGTGDYALILPVAKPATTSHRSPAVGILAGAGGALVALILGIRLVRRREPEV